MSRRAMAILACYGFGHMAVDAVCAATVVNIALGGTMSAGRAWGLILAYNVLAFGTQPFLGLAVDRRRCPRAAAVIGCSLTACGAAMLGAAPMAAVALAGLGNALFHVGGGGISLELTPGRATSPGVFVAPGALGLAIGALLATTGHGAALPFVLVLIVISGGIAVLPLPPMGYQRHKVRGTGNTFELVLLLLCFSVAARSLIGMEVVIPWKPERMVLIGLAVAAMAGKALGGIVADRLGWLRAAVLALVGSIPLLMLGATAAWMALVGMFLFQMTMPVTLAAVARMFPGQPSFAFGLPCLALIVGAMPVFVGLGPWFGRPWVTCVFLLLSAAALFKGLSGLGRVLAVSDGLQNGRIPHSAASPSA